MRLGVGARIFLSRFFDEVTERAGGNGMVLLDNSSGR